MCSINLVLFRSGTNKHFLTSSLSHSCLFILIVVFLIIKADYKKNVKHRGMSMIDKLSQECVPIPPQYASRIRWEVSAVLITFQDNIRVKALPPGWPVFYFLYRKFERPPDLQPL